MYRKGIILTCLVFSLSSILMIVSVYVLIPVFMKSGLLFGEAYLFCFYFPFILLFAGSVIMLKYEKITFDWNSISERLRLRRFDKKTVLWTIAFLVLISFGYASASLIGKYIAQNIPILSPSEFMPGGLNPNKVMQPGHFFDVPLSGKWWLAIVYFIGWFFNIFGEEFMFRGILLPIDEKSFGGKAWIFQGILWGVWHVFWLWIFIPLILFVSLPLLYVVQKMKNTWISIIIHGSLNIIPLIYIIKEIIR